MASSDTRWRDSVERWSPALFILAGVALWLLLAIGLAVRHTSTSAPRTAFWPLFPLAVALALLGLLGLAPRFVERARWPAIVGAGFAAVGAVLLVGGLGVLLVVSPPGPYPGSLGPLGAPFFLGLIAFVPAAVIYGVLGLQAGIPSQGVGGLLLLVGLLQFGELLGAEVLFARAGTAAPSESYVLFEIVIYAVIATAMVVVGYSLRREITRTGTDSMVSSPRSSSEAS